MKGVAGVDGVPAAGLSDQSRQQGAAGEVDRCDGASRKAVGRVGDGEPVQNSRRDV